MTLMNVGNIAEMRTPKIALSTNLGPDEIHLTKCPELVGFEFTINFNVFRENCFRVLAPFDISAIGDSRTLQVQ
ncbi:hypothetical protein [Streptomyces sp. SLBN-31]|uniref:hypothetical protein n=1 Tax=Streptomyces sp. SLBN-31 TaxID=2768444 RepID=UPI001153C239|nr:hypothetical protein [Streptomyces sp. SLBN-31]